MRQALKPARKDYRGVIVSMRWMCIILVINGNVLREGCVVVQTYSKAQAKELFFVVEETRKIFLLCRRIE